MHPSIRASRPPTDFAAYEPAMQLTTSLPGGREFEASPEAAAGPAIRANREVLTEPALLPRIVSTDLIGSRLRRLDFHETADRVRVMFSGLVEDIEAEKEKIIKTGSMPSALSAELLQHLCKFQQLKYSLSLHRVLRGQEMCRHLHGGAQPRDEVKLHKTQARLNGVVKGLVYIELVFRHEVALAASAKLGERLYGSGQQVMDLKGEESIQGANPRVLHSRDVTSTLLYHDNRSEGYPAHVPHSAEVVLQPPVPTKKRRVSLDDFRPTKRRPNFWWTQPAADAMTGIDGQFQGQLPSADIPGLAANNVGSLHSGGVPIGMPPPMQQGNMPNIQAGMPNIQAGIPNIQAGIPNIQGGMGSIQAGMPNIQGSMGSIQGSMPNVQAGMPNMQAGMPNMQAGMPNMQAGMPNMQAGMPNMQAGMTNIQAMPSGGMQPAAPGMHDWNLMPFSADQSLLGQAHLGPMSDYNMFSGLYDAADQQYLSMDYNPAALPPLHRGDQLPPS
ncbi:MAG: hypothetical protein KVP17_004894 [Porospora cf. gigantea B]|uniref:uncharacterized protein n=1 Tax=Porospora cf. gigantea B TaxID=2853592 RepID=UPI003571CA27|nr:MAG: hypothetical protein KVP17_004894 [Porospora cf. gigantea B]